MASLEAEDELAPEPGFPFPFRSIKELIKIILAIFWESVLYNSFSCLIVYLVNLAMIKIRSSLLSLYLMFLRWRHKDSLCILIDVISHITSI